MVCCRTKSISTGKSQLALAGEILGPYAMAGQETWIPQLGAQVLDESEEVLGDITMSGLHPQVNEGTAKLVQAK